MGSFSGRGQAAFFVFHCYAGTKGGNGKPPSYENSGEVWEGSFPRLFQGQLFFFFEKKSLLRTQKILKHGTISF